MITEEQKAIFYTAAAGATTAQKIIDAAAATTGDAFLLANEIFILAKQKRIEASPELEAYRAETTAAKAEAAAKQDRDKKAKTATEIKGIYDKLESEIIAGGVDSPQSKELLNGARELMGTLHEGKASPFISFDDYKRLRVNYEPYKDFRPKLFNGLPFPDGTINVIGARSGAGKTAALLNLARELLTARGDLGGKINDEERGEAINAKRRIIFVSREMTVEFLIDRLIKSLAWQERYTTEAADELTEIEDKDKKLYSALRGGKPISELETLYTSVIQRYVKPAMDSGRLVFIDALNDLALEDTLLHINAKARSGDIVLIDYIQLLPPTAEVGTNADYLKHRAVVQALRLTAKRTGAAFICAAQLNRTAANDQMNGKKLFETAFKDSSDIEQAAHSAVIMGRDDLTTEKTRKLYYGVVKARSSRHLDESFFVYWNSDFQYMEKGTEYEEPTGKGQNKTKKPAVKKELVGKLNVVDIEFPDFRPITEKAKEAEKKRGRTKK